MSVKRWSLLVLLALCTWGGWWFLSRAFELARDTAYAANCPLGPQADGVAFLWGVAVPRTGFTNGYVPSSATGGSFSNGWPNAFPTNQYSNYAYSLNHGYWGFYGQDA